MYTYTKQSHALAYNIEPQNYIIVYFFSFHLSFGLVENTCKALLWVFLFFASIRTRLHGDTSLLFDCCKYKHSLRLARIRYSYCACSTPICIFDFNNFGCCFFPPSSHICLMVFKKAKIKLLLFERNVPRENCSHTFLLLPFHSFSSHSPRSDLRFMHTLITWWIEIEIELNNFQVAVNHIIFAAAQRNGE